jgi:hypothetical protein
MWNLINISSAVLDILRAERRKVEMREKKRKTGKMKEGIEGEGVRSSWCIPVLMSHTQRVPTGSSTAVRAKQYRVPWTHCLRESLSYNYCNPKTERINFPVPTPSYVSHRQTYLWATHICWVPNTDEQWQLCYGKSRISGIRHFTFEALARAPQLSWRHQIWNII